MRIAPLARSLAAALALSAPVVVVTAACDPVKLPHEQPGPAGCGLKDPRQTAPGMLSIAQKEAFRQNGSPDDVRKNDKGGLDWLYRRASGSMFGEEQTVEVLQFGAEGLLVGRSTDVVRKVGK